MSKRDREHDEIARRNQESADKMDDFAPRPVKKYNGYVRDDFRVLNDTIRHLHALVAGDCANFWAGGDTTATRLRQYERMLKKAERYRAKVEDRIFGESKQAKRRRHLAARMKLRSYGA